jgi:flagellin
MSMVINTNTTAIGAARLLSQASGALNQSITALSSGSKLTAMNGADMAVSMRFGAQINRIGAASNNVANATSFAQTQDGFLSNVNDALNRMSELSVMAQDGTKTDSDRALYQQEYSTLGSYITDLSHKDFNGVSLFNGTAMQVTTDSDANKFSMTGISLSTTSYTGAINANISTLSGANSALTAVKTAISQLATDRATEGASQTRLSKYSAQLGVLSDNLTAANSLISDVDVAHESTKYASRNILVQAGTAMLAQANTAPQAALRLLG